MRDVLLFIPVGIMMIALMAISWVAVYVGAILPLVMVLEIIGVL